MPQHTDVARFGFFHRDANEGNLNDTTYAAGFESSKPDVNDVTGNSPADVAGVESPKPESDDGNRKWNDRNPDDQYDVDFFVSAMDEPNLVRRLLMVWCAGVRGRG